uniref:Uncharacterized protein n=1 Tax=Arundo donax TaxID=35708 RepID=A0A0A9H3W4_ARUDO
MTPRLSSSPRRWLINLLLRKTHKGTQMTETLLSQRWKRKRGTL